MYCRECGNQIPDNSLRCPDCDTKTGEGFDFCNYCGQYTTEKMVHPKYETLFGDLQKKTRMKKSLDKLKLQLEQQERQGELAELFVLEYEKKRITNSTLNEKIKRISIIDVAAGYDIVS